MINIDESIIDILPVGILKGQFEFDKSESVDDFKVFYINQYMETLSGFKKMQIEGKRWKELYPDSTNLMNDWINAVRDAVKAKEHRHLNQYVDMFNKHLSMDIIGLEGGSFYLILNDNTERLQHRKAIMEKESEIDYVNSELRKKANMDIMTSTYNYQFILKLLKEEIDSAKIQNTKLSVALLDIDNFTVINRKYGADVGNVVLIETAAVFRNCIRKIDYLGRTGADEFMLILTNVDMDIAKIIINRIQTQLFLNIQNAEDIEVTISGAVIEYTGENDEEFYYNIREKLNNAKSMGKNVIVFQS
ncbi:MAG: Periplasmic substrate-binding diguanylate cyclase [Clostridiales bacterium 38_11]|nr:MAG: Periplasmic substrate-binding diguanylate cyclase [Clostridiales bacterium 38_11]